MSDEQLKKHAGIYRNEKTHTAGRFVFENGELRTAGTTLRPMGDGLFMLGSTRVTFAYDDKGAPISAKLVSPNGDVTNLIAEKDWTPTAAELAVFAGPWFSDEAQASFTFVAEGDKAYITQRPTTKLPLQPLFKDHFSVAGQILWFTRDKSGKIDKMHIGASRMRRYAV